MDSSALEANYQAGVCNIGPAEIHRRRTSGWIGLATTLVVWAAFAFAGLAPAWHWALFVPAFAGATGFIQARSKFCVNYGMRNMFNFGAIGSTDQVEDAEARRLDRIRSWRIVGTAAAVATAIAVVGVFTA